MKLGSVWSSLDSASTSSPDDETLEKMAMAIAWGELGLRVKTRSFWLFFDRDRARFRQEARHFLAVLGEAMRVVDLPAVQHGLAFAVTHGVSFIDVDDLPRSPQ